MQTERHGHVLLIRMMRTGKRNAVDAAMTTALDDALNELDDDPDLWCGVLAGDATAFSAGTDLAAGSGGPTPRGGNYGVVRRDRRRPLIAAVEGVAYGGGFEIVLACDMVVAGTGARFALPEVARGLVANCGALFRTPRPLPLNVAKQLLITGRPIDAQRAYSLGLVNELVEPGAAEAAALELARQVCANSPLAVSVTLRALERVVSEPDDRGWAATEVATAAIERSADRVEGVAAFLEKRPPRWTGR
ncbi:enoyl-CoA hydratase/carnithine racemase [Pseudonocardia autotrophica]|uniref:Carnitinyl-CoA dehydratase n=2 Tax=Pseudonocardia TaxID=1847 RepID=A0A1Y2N2Y8_PSEAH|nr:Carnitinyl-CoA dehydratase [Pseudonocardia autotrophica]TDN71113.1 enoyl-CoA hydratase/carnithine racemase [Pseudonocardia autotrophica]BBG01783.1 enoyl-CoA hydratase [Pseudonocardia autotrophica]GEC26268.1 enoyl-CoA hydratase [Pseudonocardia saturnea]